MRSLQLLPVLALAGLAGSGCHVDFADCTEKAHREARIETAGVKKVVLDTGAGELRIVGRPGATALVAEGEACASSQSRLEDIQIRYERKGDVLHLWTGRDRGTTVHIGWDDEVARLDLNVELPAELPLEVDDGSGNVSIRSVSSLVLDDGSGDLELADLHGDVRIEDGSGSLELLGVDGDVVLEDDSGEVRVTGVKGKVTLEDGSGNVSVSQVGGNVEVREDGSGDLDIFGIGQGVRVRSDGSGDISIRDVTGDVTVEDDGSGTIEVKGVTGQVSIPEDKRRRDRR